MSLISSSSNKTISKLSLLRKDSKTSVQDLTKEDFIIGDNVYIASNPDRLGTVMFIGITKFSDGNWIGVALDKPFGKNNGIVQGVQYFQCEENHGIFVRANNLRPVSVKNLNEKQEFDCNIPYCEEQLNKRNLVNEVDDHVFLEPFAISISTSNLCLSDRVFVAGKSSNSIHKNGRLRFLGYTKFAEGIWAGIELDNPVGKNDGSVNGVRYFSCKPQYGLFALEQKVKKMDLSTTKGYSRIGSCSKYGSNESISSTASNFSSASRTRVRLGMNAVGTANKIRGDKSMENVTDKNKSSRLNVRDMKGLDKTSAIQTVLKEKEQHVEQLIREREIERIDLATATAKIDELEKQKDFNFNEQKLIYDKKFSELQNTVYLLCQEKDQLFQRFEEEKKKVEDLLFRIEEKNIDESDLEHKTEENESQIFELHEKLALERELREELEKKLNNTSSLNQSCVNEEKYTFQIKELEGKMNDVESKYNNELNNSKFISKLLEEKAISINVLQDELERAKAHLSESYKEADVIKNIQIEENQSLKSEIISLKSVIEHLNESLSELKNENIHTVLYQPNEIINSLHTEQCIQTEECNTVQVLKESLEILKVENVNLQNGVTSLNDKIKLSNQTIEEKQLQYSALEQRCKQIELEKELEINLIQSLTEENLNLKNVIETFIKENKDINCKLGSLEEELKIHRQNTEENQLRYDELEYKYKDLELEKIDAVTSINSLTEDIIDLKDIVENLKNNKEDSILTVESLNKESQLRNHTMEEKQLEYNVLDEKYKELQLKNAEQIKLNDCLAEEIIQLKNTLANYNNENENVKRELVTLQNDFELLQLGNEEKQVKWEQKCQELEQQAKDHNFSTDLLTEENKKLVANLFSYKGQLKNVQCELLNLQNYNNKHVKETESEDFSSKNKDLLNDLDILRRENEKINLTLTLIKEESELRLRDADFKLLECKDLQLKCNQLEHEKEDQIKSNQFLTDEIKNMRNNFNAMIKENETIKYALTSANDESSVCRQKFEDKQLEFVNLEQNVKYLQTEMDDQKFSNSALIVENEKLCSQISTYHDEFERQRTALSELNDHNKKLMESNVKINDNEENMKIMITEMESQIECIEKENSTLKENINELQNDPTTNSRVLQMSIKIDDLETSMYNNDLKADLQLQKEQNAALIFKNTALDFELEHLKNKMDNETDNLFEQLESFKSINQLLEADKLSFSELLDSKNKELMVIRDRLLKISQEYERLQENFNENSQKFEGEKRRFNDKVRKLEKQLEENERKSQLALSESTNEKRKIDSKDNILSLKASKENSEQQISFLNSIIIEREKKFTVLQAENSSLKETIKDLENANIWPVSKPKKIIPPRLYCDVCEIFDSHDTDKCTVIEDRSTPSSPQLSLRKVKISAKAPRLYCDICEVFDAHDTPYCQDQLTF